MVPPRPPVWLRPPEGPFEAVVIGASAGGTRAIRTILSSMSSDFPGAILVAIHRGHGPAGSDRSLFRRHTALHVTEAVDGEPVTPGTVYVAPAGRHLEVDGDRRFYTRSTGLVGVACPSADLLFESAAAVYGDRAVAVVLSGYGRDGADGVRAIRDHGGFVIAQDEGTSEQPGMPQSAVETRRVDIVLPLRHIAFALTTIFGRATTEATA